MNDTRAGRSRRLGTAIAVLGTIAVLIFWMLRGGGGPAVPQRSETASASTTPAAKAAVPEAPAVAAAPVATPAQASEPTAQEPGSAKPAGRTFPLTGLVRRRDDKTPIEGAVVGVYDLGARGDDFVPAGEPLPEPLVETTTDAQGRYRLPAVPSRVTGAYHFIIARAPDCCASLATYFMKGMPTKGEIDAPEVDFEMPPGGPLQGTVVDDAGNPVPGALVGGLLLQTMLGQDPGPPGARRRAGMQRVWFASAIARAAADGSFLLEGFPSDVDAPVPAQADGYIRGFSDSVRAGAKDFRIVLRPGGARVFGKLLAADDSPLAAHPITMYSAQASGMRAPLTAISAADGSFVFRNVGQGSYNISARPPREMTPLAQQLVAVPADGEYEVLLKVAPAIDVRGRFVDVATKRGVPGVLLSDTPDAMQREQMAGWMNPDAEAGKVPTTAVTDAEGRFAMKLPQSPWGGTGLYGTLPLPWQPRMQPPAMPPAGKSLIVNASMALASATGTRAIFMLQGKLEGAGEIEFEVSRGIAIAGTVILSADRAPVPKASVSLSNVLAGGSQLLTATTDDAGAFQLFAPAPGTYELRCTTDAGSGFATVEVSADRPPPPVELLLGEPSGLAGAVVDVDGAPAPGYLVIATAHGTGGTMRWNEVNNAVVDSQGRFDFGVVAPGKYTLQLHWTGTGGGTSRGGTPDAQIVEVAAGERKSDILFELSPASSLLGTVKDEDGNPIEGAIIDFNIWGSMNHQSGSATSRADGSFELTGVPEETIVNTMSAAKVGFARETKQNIGWDTPSVDFTLKKLAARRLVVQDVAGKPVTSYLYRMDVESGSPYQGDGRSGSTARELVRNSKDGSATVPPPLQPEALYDITALELDEAQAARVAFTGRIGRARVSFADPEDTSDIVIVVGGTGAIRGRVVDAQGGPVAGAAVGHAKGDERSFWYGGWDTQSAQPEDSLMKIPEVRTDAQGAFAMTNVPAGDYRLSASKDGMTCLSPVAVTLETGGAVDGVELVLHATGGLEGTVTGIDGKPAPQSQLWFHRVWKEGEPQQHLERQYNAVTDSDGRYRMEAMAPGSYMGSVNVPQQGTKSISEGIEVTAGAVATVDFSLEGTARVRVLLSIDGERKPMMNAMVRMEPDPPAENGADTTYLGGDMTGGATGTVPPGRYVIAVSAQTGGTHYHGPVEVLPGTEVQEFAVEVRTASADIVLVYPDGGEPPEPVNVYLYARRPNQPDHARQWAGMYSLRRRSHQLPKLFAGTYYAEAPTRNGSIGPAPNSGWVTVGPGLENAIVIMMPEPEATQPTPTPAP